MTPQEAGQRIRALAKDAAQQLTEPGGTPARHTFATSIQAARIVADFAAEALPELTSAIVDVLPSLLLTFRDRTDYDVDALAVDIIETLAVHAEEHMDAMRKPRDLEFESPQVAMDLAITAICANAHAKASDPSTTPAELKELALAIGGLIGSAQPGDVQLVEARATVAILETELVKARQVAAENGAACDALKAELAKVKEKLSMRESTAAVHVLLDTLRIPEGQLWDRIKCIEVVRNRLDAAGFNDDDMSQAVRDALLVAATAKRLAFEVETIRQNQNNIVGEKVAEVLDECSKEIDRADAPKVSFAARVKWLVDELLRLKDASRVDDVNRIHKVLDDAKVPAGHIVERAKQWIRLFRDDN